MKNILTIISKEFARFFKDRRLVLGTLLLPGLLIFLLYTLMGSVLYDDSHTYTVKAVHLSPTFAQIFAAEEGEEPSVRFEEIDASEAEAAKEEILAGNCDALIVFTEDFDAILAGGSYAPPGGEDTPNVQIWYDASSGNSSSVYSLMRSALDTLEDNISNRFDVNSPAAGGGSLTSGEEAATSFYAQLMPFLILTLLFSGCMGVAPESIAGEKERGTIATLMVTPVKRSELVVGKVVSLSVISALSAISSFIGTFLSMPKLMGGNIGDLFAAYSAWEYLALFAVMLSAVLLIVSLISILSSLAKSVKEATTYSVPLMIVVMLVGLSSMLFTTSVPAAHLIPIFNCVQVMSAIFAGNFSAVNLLIALGSNLVYIVLLVFALARMFKSERIMFNR